MHLLVAAYLGYEGEREPEPQQADEAPATNPAGWLGGNTGGMQPSAELAAASTPEQALAAAERMFFGQMTELPKP